MLVSIRIGISLDESWNNFPQTSQIEALLRERDHLKANCPSLSEQCINCGIFCKITEILAIMAL
nr:hypothetical protein [Bacilli bacterium]